MGQWYDDPRGRYEKRWHDGDQWTAHVANGGQTSRDPLGVGPTPVGPASTAPPPPATGYQSPAGNVPVPGYAPAAGKPDNYLVWAILTTLFCCLPFGIVSIVQSTKVDAAWTTGQYDEARRLSTSAKNWATAAGLVGLAVVIVYLLFYAALLGSI